MLSSYSDHRLDNGRLKTILTFRSFNLLFACNCFYYTTDTLLRPVFAFLYVCSHVVL